MVFTEHVILKLSLSRADVRTPMHAHCGNGHFCPAAPMRHAPAGNFPLLPNSCGPNKPKTTSKPDRGSLLLGTLAQTIGFHALILLKKSTILTPTPHPPIMEVFSFELVVRFPEIAQASSSLLGCCNHHHHHWRKPSSLPYSLPASYEYEQ